MEDRSNSLFINLRQDIDVERFLSGLELSLELVDLCVKEQMVRDVKTAVYRLRRVYSGLTANSKKEWITAFKKHKSIIAKLSARLIDLSVLNGISNPILLVLRSKIIFLDGEEIEEARISPASFWKIYKLLAYVVRCKNSDELIAVLRVINTVCSLCKDFSLTPEQKDEDVLKQIQEIESEELSIHSDKIWEERILDTLETISRGVKGQALADEPKEVREFVAGIRSVAYSNRSWQLTPKDLKISTASTGCSCKGLTIPAYFSSLVEGCDDLYDYSQFDEIIGYTPNDPLICVPNLKSKRNNCVAIESNKDSMRLVHTLMGKYHDRLTFFERIRKSILRNVSSDHSFDHHGGQFKIRNWMRNRKIRAIYSLDLHAATNTLSLQWQKITTEFMLRWLGFSEDDIVPLVSVWERIMKFDTQVTLPHSRKTVKFSFKSGQPMGFSDSFYSFAMLHHIAVLSVLRFNRDLKSEGYCITGDDLVNAVLEDPDLKFPDQYISCMAFLNTECNLEKGYIFNRDVPGYDVKIAEFCKFLICEGVDITPIPLGMLTQSHEQVGRLNILGWLLTHSKKRLTIESLIRLGQFDSDGKLALCLLQRMPLSNILSSRKGAFRMNTPCEFEDRSLILAASIAWIRQSMILTVLVEKNRDRNYIPKYSDLNSFSKDLKKMFKQILELPDYYELQKTQKFLYFISQLQLKAAAIDIVSENILQGILPEMDLIDVLPTLKDLCDTDLERLVSLSEFVLSCDTESGESSNSWLFEDTVATLLDIIEEMDSFSVDSTNHRFGSNSDKVNRGMDYKQFITDTVYYFKRITNKDPDEEIRRFLQNCDELDKSAEVSDFDWEAKVIDTDQQLRYYFSDSEDSEYYDEEEDDEVSPWDLI